MENEFSAAGGGGNVLRNALKADMPLLKQGDSFDEVLEGAA